MKNTQKGSALLVTILIVVILASVGALFFSQQLFRSETGEVQVQTQVTPNPEAPPIVAPPVKNPPQEQPPKTIPPVVEKKTITYIPNAGNATHIVIDFSVCKAGSGSVVFGLGHTVFNFTGITNGICNFQHGTEIENPMWDRAMDHTCAVPVSLGARTYKVGDFGIAMNELHVYCPWVKLLEPNGGEVLQSGQKYEIIWRAEGVETVSISLVSGGKDLGSVQDKTSFKASDGKFTWTVPDMSGWYQSGMSQNNFRLFISADGKPDVRDTSDGTFTIQ